MNKSLIIALLSISFSYGQNTGKPDSKTAKEETKYKISSSITDELIIETDDKPIEIKKPDENQLWSSAGIEVKPEYPGGWGKFMEDFNKEFRLKVEEDLKGRIFLDFVVERNGTLTDLKIIRDLGFGAGNEALRVLKSMPKWKPGIQDGKTLRVRYTLPLIIDIKANTDFNQYTPPANKKNIQELKDKH